MRITSKNIVIVILVSLLFFNMTGISFADKVAKTSAKKTANNKKGQPKASGNTKKSKNTKKSNSKDKKQNKTVNNKDNSKSKDKAKNANPALKKVTISNNFKNLMFDNKTGTILSKNGENDRILQGKAVTLLTTLIILENHKANDEVIAVKNFVAPKGSTINVVAGEKFRVIDLLYAINLTCANDAIRVLAEADSGVVNKFTEKLNNRAKQLGMVTTNFISPYVSTNKNQFTSLNDLSIVLKELLKYEEFLKIANTESYEISATNKTAKPRKNLKQENDLIFNTKKMYVVNGKTYSLYDNNVKGLKVSTVKNSGSICASLKVSNKLDIVALNYTAGDLMTCYAENKFLLEKAVKEYKVETLVNKGEVVEQAKAKDGDDAINLVSREKFALLMSSSEDVQKTIEKKVDIFEFTKNDVDKGAKLGVVEFFKAGKSVAKVGLYPQKLIDPDQFVGQIKIPKKKKSKYDIALSVAIIILKIVVIFVLWTKFVRRRRRKLAIARRNQYIIDKNKKEKVVDFDIYRSGQ